MAKLNVFIPITKVDVAKRLVYGIATSEKVDKAGEVMDYDSTKPLYKEWTDDFEKATNGKSLGNVREMHSNIAAGKLTSISFDDENKKIEVCAHVVDDSSWKKVQEGVLTGFSHGGDYIARWKDKQNPEITRYTAKPSELSLVDNPCLAEATFELIRADGGRELRKFTSTQESNAMTKDSNDNYLLQQGWMAKDGTLHKKRESAEKSNAEFDAKELAKQTAAPAQDAIDALNKQLSNEAPAGDDAAKEGLAKKAQEDDDLAKAADDYFAKKDFSDDKRKELATSGKAMPDGSYLIENTEDLKNAVQAYGRAKDKAKTKAHIIARAKALNDTAALPEGWGAEKSAETGTLRKDLHTVARLACLIQELDWLHQCSESEERREGDDSKLPDELKQDIADICMTLRAMVDEETTELFSDDAEVEQLIEAIDEHFEVGPMEHAIRVNGLAKHVGAMKPFDEAELEKPEIKKRAESMVAFHQALQKAGARHSAADAARLQDIHDSAHEMHKCMGDMTKMAGEMKDNAIDMGAKGTKTEAEKTAPAGDLMKAENVKLSAQYSALAEQMTKMTFQLTDALARVKKVEDQPLPAKGALRNVNKGSEGSPASGGTPAASDIVIGPYDSPETMVAKMMKSALQKPQEGNP